jgi:hypothetical protein
LCEVVNLVNLGWWDSELHLLDRTHFSVWTKVWELNPGRGWIGAWL